MLRVHLYAVSLELVKYRRSMLIIQRYNPSPCKQFPDYNRRKKINNVSYKINIPSS